MPFILKSSKPFTRKLKIIQSRKISGDLAGLLAQPSVDTFPFRLVRYSGCRFNWVVVTESRITRIPYDKPHSRLYSYGDSVRF